MRIAIPISEHDVKFLPAFTKAMCKFAHTPGHKIYLFPLQGVQPQAFEAAKEFSSSGWEVDVQPITGNFLEGDNWPKNPNLHFFNVVQALQSGYFFWLELDACPVKDNWAEIIETEYQASGKRFMGVIKETPFRDSQGNIVKGNPDDLMMVGNGVYLVEALKRMPGLNDLGTGPRSASSGFDVHLRFEMRSFGWHNTSLISDQWNTQSYRTENGAMVCDAAPSRFPSRARGGVVNPEAVIVHGCKDGSLHQLVIGDAKPKKFEAPVIEPARTELVTASASFLDSLYEKLESKADTWWKSLPNESQDFIMKFNSGNPEVKKVAELENWNPDKPSNDLEVPLEMDPPVELLGPAGNDGGSSSEGEAPTDIFAILKPHINGPVKIRFTALVEKTKLPKDDVERVLGEHGYWVKSPGWVMPPDSPHPA